MLKRNVHKALNVGAAALFGGGSAAVAAGSPLAGATEPTGSGHAASVNAPKDLNPNSLQSCVPYFGLGKTTSNLAKVEVYTSGEVTPAPVVGTNLFAVVTATDASNVVVRCKLDPQSLAWTSEADFFATYLNGQNSQIGPYAYPGSADFYMTPAVGATFTIGSTSFTPASVTVALATSIPNVTINQIGQLEDIEHGHFTWNSAQWFPLAGDLGVIGSKDQMLGVGGTQGAADMLGQLQVDGNCSETGAAITSFNAHIHELSTNAQPPYDCTSTLADIPSFFVYNNTIFGEKVKYAPVTVTLVGPEPTTTSTLAPTTDPSGLANTGSPLNLLSGFGAVLLGLGASLALRARRLRRS